MDRKAGAAGLLRVGSLMISRVLTVALGVGLMLWLAFLPGCNSQNNASRRALQQVRPANNTALLVQNAAYLKRVGRLELAVEDLEQAHLQEPENLEILDALTQSYEELGDFERAQELYEEALSRGHHPALENNRAYSLYLQGKLGQAEACFRKILARQPDNKTARNNLGLVLCRQGREAEALVMWREALNDAEARQHLGQALAALGKEVPPSLAAPTPPPAEQQVAAAGHPAAPASIGKSQPSSRTPRAMSSPPTLAATPFANQMPIGDQIPPGDIYSATTPALASVPSGQAQVKGASSSPEATQSRAAAVAAAAASPAKKPKIPVMTVLDLEGTRIEVKNGNGIQDQARETRSLLSLEGFNVVGIGNHIDFGLDDTIISYRPESAKVARALVQKFFPGAKLEEGGKVSPGADIRVSLGRNQLGEQNFAAAPAEIDKGHKQATSAPAALPDYLTAQELNSRIEVKNGNGVTGQAWEVGGHLALEGFRVVNIANSRDFGLEKTVITYRPEATRVAQAIYKKFLPKANLQEDGTLPPWTDVRVSLGRDLISGHRHLAQSYSGEAIP